jgi:hypothetical protein
LCDAACELLVGLDDRSVLAAERADGVLTVLVESTATVVVCAGCGTRATVKDRPEVALGDLALSGGGLPGRVATTTR